MSTTKNNSFSTHHLFKKNNPANWFSLIENSYVGKTNLKWEKNLESDIYHALS